MFAVAGIRTRVTELAIPNISQAVLQPLKRSNKIYSIKGY
ncbi:MAG: hypothetical protein YK1309IOTA_400006 [Marine Group I thaumarchaeote]|nr:MAG: hypothetical protein YK1309IOTA_400006 [Marine Group I thaumarchaeote]